MADTSDKVPHTYVEADKKLEDASSTAWSFTLLGIIGIAVLVLIWTGILPVRLSIVTLSSGTMAMGILFFIFLILGIRGFHERKKLLSARAKEEADIFQIRQWFQEHYSADAISNGVEEDELPVEQLYFLRSENISRAMKEEFPELEESFAEYMMELIYQMYFPD